MNLSTISGHLTATEKKHITHLLNNKVFQGKINRKSYFITTQGNGLYSVTIRENLTNWCETQPRITTHNHTFRAQE